MKKNFHSNLSICFICLSVLFVYLFYLSICFICLSVLFVYLFYLCLSVLSICFIFYESFISGWTKNEKVYGRPVDLLELADGSLLISDDAFGKIYRVTYK